MPPTEATFWLSPSYGLLTARDAHDWFLSLMREHEEFEVDTDRAGAWPVPFSSETVKAGDRGVAASPLRNLHSSAT